jgi:hypothetical protein
VNNLATSVARLTQGLAIRKTHNLRPLVLLCCLAATVFSTCAHPSTDAPDPQRQIIQHLARCRVVMLGDFAHEFPMSYRSLASTLTAWFAMVKSGESDDRQMTLFLEENHQVTDLVTQYLKTGDLKPLLYFLAPGTSLERLEFYSNLRELATQIDSLNRTLPASKQISLEIEGPEAFTIFDPAMIDLPDRESRLFFIKDRDSVSAVNVLGYLSRHPDRKGLMFFGTGHLIKKAVNKDYWGTFTPEQGTGWYLAHYLKQALGDELVFTVCQIDRGLSRLDLERFAGSDVFFLASDAPWGIPPSDNRDLVPENFDAFIIRDGFSIQAHDLGYIFSSTIAEAALRRLEFAEQHRSGAMGNRIYNQAANVLARLADTVLSSPDAWKVWFANHKLKGPARVLSGEMRQRRENQTSEALGTPQFGRAIDELISMGFDSRVGSRRMSNEEWRQHFAAQWPQILMLNMIGAMWVGSPEEQAIAAPYLARSCGQKFSRPEQYLKWWRKHFFDVTY